MVSSLDVICLALLGIQNNLGGTLCKAHISGIRLEVAKTLAPRNWRTPTHRVHYFIYISCTSPMPSQCDCKASKPFKSCSFLMPTFLDQIGLSWVSHLPSHLNSQPEPISDAQVSCTGWQCLPCAVPDRHWCFLTAQGISLSCSGAESRGWFLQVASETPRALKDSQCKSWEVSPLETATVKKAETLWALVSYWKKRHAKADYIISCDIWGNRNTMLHSKYMQFFI